MGYNYHMFNYDSPSDMNSAWALESHLRVLIDTVWRYITKEGVDPRILTMRTDIINHVMGFKIMELHQHLQCQLPHLNQQNTTNISIPV